MEKKPNLNGDATARIGNWIQPRLARFESIILPLVFLGIMLRVIGAGFDDFILTISISTLSLLYFLRAFSISSDGASNTADAFIVKLIYWGMAVVTIGVLFRLQTSPGWDTMLIVGILVLIIGMTVALIRDSKRSELMLIDKRTAVRILVAVLIGIALLFTPTEYLQKNRKILQDEEVIG